MTTTPAPPAPPLELSDLLPEYRFGERHRRRVDLAIERVWPAALAVTQREVRLLGPLTAIRELPARLRVGARPDAAAADRPLLEGFVDEGFLPVRTDAAPHDGRAVVLFCAAGPFWSPTRDAALHLATVAEFVECTTPKVAKLAATLEAVDCGDHTELVTETRVAGTDAAANRAFGAYWCVIRGPSGLIRRSWLAAIARRAFAEA